ncbi:MAG: polysaccharide biosynthesis tyrosine autokinase [Planctomycetaceae bacterium]|nr:MAG: polysaccharide biosynthesis tyrosine autokinase [Planctomycetaceae bacterium]
MALLCGLVLGGGIAAARDWIDQTIRSTEEISTIFRLPVLGGGPAMSRRKSVPVRGRKVLLEPSSREAEAFRIVRTAVFFGAPNGKAKTTLITSPGMEDGKSTLVSNLAIAMARAGQKTLILDADLRKPIQHRIFDINHQEQCLCSVLEGKVKLSQAIQPTQVPGLSLLTCGYGIGNPAEVLNSPQFAKLLAYLGRAYDRIIVDAPPVTAVTDAQILGALCDFTILVLRADRSTREITQRAIEALRGVGGRLLGIVVNQVHRDGGRYGYYGGHYRLGRSNHKHGPDAKAHDTCIGMTLQPLEAGLSRSPVLRPS